MYRVHLITMYHSSQVPIVFLSVSDDSEAEADRRAAHSHELLTEANSSAGHRSLEQGIFQSIRNARLTQQLQAAHAPSDEMEIDENESSSTVYLSESIFTKDGFYNNVWAAGYKPGFFEM
jgi:hypothetical protein